MKRVGRVFDDVLDRENLRWAFWKAARGKRDRRDVRAFAADLEGNLADLAEGLRRGTFPVGRFQQFVIYDPKQRVITAPCFAERVMHHAVMNVCEPVFERWLIRDTYACRVGRGREAAIARARRLAGKHAFFLKCDIRSYFDSIAHEELLRRLQRLFKDPRMLAWFERVIGSFRGNLGRGLPIGSLTSQHFANFYLGWFDRFVKEVLHVPGYVRYMDDMILWGPSSAAVRSWLGRCEEYLGAELSLTFKPSPYINRTRHGADFLGCRVFPDHVLLNRRSRRRFARKLKSLELRYLASELSEEELQARATSLVAFTQAAGAKSWHFRSAVLKRTPVSGRRPATG